VVQVQVLKYIDFGLELRLFKKELFIDQCHHKTCNADQEVRSRAFRKGASRLGKISK
jgi:hypothetical protein